MIRARRQPGMVPLRFLRSTAPYKNLALLAAMLGGVLVPELQLPQHGPAIDPIGPLAVGCV